MPATHLLLRPDPGHADSFRQRRPRSTRWRWTRWGHVAGDGTYSVFGILETYNAASGWGNGNFGRYSNRRMVPRARVLREAHDRDRASGCGGLQEAINTAWEDYGALIPLHSRSTIGGLRTGSEHYGRGPTSARSPRGRGVD